MVADQPEETPRNLRVSNRQERVAAALASGRTVAAAARDCRVNEGTIWEWMKQSGFKERVAELRQLLTDRTIGRLSELLAGSAMDTLVQLLHAESDNLKLE